MHLEYPRGFPQDRQFLVEVEKIRADRDFESTEQSVGRRDQALSFTELEQRALRWVCRVLGAFAYQACELGKNGSWTLLQIGPAVEEFRLQLIRKVNFRMTDGRLRCVDRVFGTEILPEVRHSIEDSVEWRRYRDELLEVAEGYTPVVSRRADLTENSSLKELAAPAGLAGPESADHAGIPEHRLAEASNRQMSAPENASLQVLKTGKRRGRRPNQERRDAIRTAVRTHADQWRDHLSDIFTELDRHNVPLAPYLRIFERQESIMRGSAQ
jgi:hypothetical protein